MIIVGCDFHPSWEQVSWLDSETGETGEAKLVHVVGEAQQFYRELPAPALIGLEATGNCHWLQDLLADLGHEVWIGDAAQIRGNRGQTEMTPISATRQEESGTDRSRRRAWNGDLVGAGRAGARWIVPVGPQRRRSPAGARCE